MLALFPPTVRLLLVVATTSAFVLINDLLLSAVVFLVSAVVLISNRRFPYVPVTFMVLTTMLMYFFSNFAFSPTSKGGLVIWAFRFNSAGFDLGLIGGFKRSAMVTLSLAWLTGTRIPEIYQALAFVKPGRRWLMLFLRLVQLVKRDIDATRQSLLIRDRERSALDVRGRLFRLKLMLQALLLRVFSLVGRVAYAAESHAPGMRTVGDLELLGVSAEYYQTGTVLRDIDLKIGAGEFVFVAGRNGSGKTTLLRVLSGYIPRITGSLSGRVCVAGHDLGDLTLASLSHSIRYVPADSVVSVVGLTVGQEISLASDDGIAGKAALELMGATHLCDRETTTLSGGEQMRVLLASILSSGTQILVLDSPLEQLDWASRRKLLSTLEGHAKRGGSVVLTDTDYPTVSRYVSRFILLENGVVALDSDPHQLSEDVLVRAGLATPEVPESVPTVDGSATCAQMEGIRVVLGGTEVLRGFDFAVKHGECVGVVGPNGSGKTTAMLTLAGVIRPASGNLELSGRVAYVFQDTSLQMVEPLSRDEIAIGPGLRGWGDPARAAYVVDMLRWARMNGQESSVDVSSGESKLLGISAMVMDCPVVAIDEPSTGLDAFAVEAVSTLVKDLRARGVGVIVVTHDARMIRLATRVVVVESGKVSRECDSESAIGLMQQWMADER
jgi:energy-coupling factor transport system ATP-binding protein